MAKRTQNGESALQERLRPSAAIGRKWIFRLGVATAGVILGLFFGGGRLDASLLAAGDLPSDCLAATSCSGNLSLLQSLSAEQRGETHTDTEAVRVTYPPIFGLLPASFVQVGWSTPQMLGLMAALVLSLSLLCWGLWAKRLPGMRSAAASQDNKKDVASNSALGHLSEFGLPGMAKGQQAQWMAERGQEDVRHAGHKDDLPEEAASQRAHPGDPVPGDASAEQAPHSAWKLYGLLLLLLAGGIFWARQGSVLRKGQVIKQFVSFSLTESLGINGMRIDQTRVPCPDPAVPGSESRRWAEEPPVFHVLAARLAKLGWAQPESLPLLAFLGLWLGLLGLALCGGQSARGPLQTGDVARRRGWWDGGWRRLAQWQNQLGEGVWVGTAAAASPIFLRYSVQHVPDLLATGFLVWGAWALFLRWRFFAFLFFTAAVTTKALAWVAVVTLTLWDVALRRKKRAAMISSLVRVSLTLVPFMLWVGYLQLFSIPSPFHWHNWIENRHAGSLLRLLQGAFWLRLGTWSVAKGMGWVLFVGVTLAAVRSVIFYFLPAATVTPTTTAPAQPGRRWGWFLGSALGERMSVAPIDSMLWFWGWGLLPFWALIREGNWVHDYYVMPFIPPFALLGARAWMRIQSRRMGLFLLCLSVALAVLQLVRLKEQALVEGQLGRPQYCDQLQ